MACWADAVLAVDVDGTLHNAGVVNEAAVAFVRRKHAEGFALILWSAGGADHARSIAEQIGIVELFTAIISKPFYVLDDEGWNWIKWTKVIQSFEE